MPKISICIPYHNTEGTAGYLARALASIEIQTYKNYEIVLTNEGTFANNHNAAIQKATGEIVQMLQMDDSFAHEHALQSIVDRMYPFHGGGSGGGQWYGPDPVWAISACLHNVEGEIGNPHLPQWTDDIWTGNNRLGSVSTLAFRRDKALLFEHPLTWLVDCDLYYRLFLRYGNPTIIEDYNLIIDTRPSRLSSTLSDKLKAEEVDYLTKKYG